MIVFNRRHYRVTPLNMQSFPDLSRVFFEVQPALLQSFFVYFLPYFRAFCTQLEVFEANAFHASTKSPAPLILSSTA